MTQALHTLLDHAERQRNEALALLLQAEEQVRRLQLQAQQLNAYRDDYRQRQPGRGGNSVSIELLRSHHEFMQRLQQAMDQQQGQQQAAEARLATRRSELLALETRVASVRKLMERRGQEALRRARQPCRPTAPTASAAPGLPAPTWRRWRTERWASAPAAPFQPFLSLPFSFEPLKECHEQQQPCTHRTEPRQPGFGTGAREQPICFWPRRRRRFRAHAGPGQPQPQPR
jgi:flagellar FliJ protein